MKMSLPSFLTIALLAVPMISPFFKSSANGQSPSFEQPNQEDAQDDQGTPRVTGLQSVQGEVSFQRAGDKEWVEAVTNLPLLTGDQIYTGNRSSAVIQMAHGSFIRLSERTAIAITDLSEQGAQLEITSGSAVVQLYRLEDVFGRFEIDTPVAAAVLQQDGVYRVQVHDSGEIEFATRDGLAEVTTEDATLKVRAGFRLQAGGKGSGKLDVLAIASFDDWDLAGSPLDTTIDAAVISDPGTSPSPDYVGSYQDTYSSLYGLDELSDCGTWTNVASYGNCWIPRVGYGWAPYRSGRWLWVPAIGWAWLPGEPWGWAPYHYGRWSFIPGLGWAWVPGFGPERPPYPYGYRYYAWRPGLVYFFNYSTPGGRYVGWQPLGPGEVWHRPGWYERHPNQAGWGRPIYRASNNGVSVLPIGAFNGSAAGRPEAPIHEHGRLLQGIDRPHSSTAPISAGLAGVQPGRFAGNPVRPVDGSKTFAIQPPSGIINRPVLTRHLPAGAVAVDDGNQVRRERRLVQPVASGGPGPVRGSGSAWTGDSNPNSGGQGDQSRGLKRHNPSLGDGGSAGAGSYTPGNRGEDRRRLREDTESTNSDSPRHKNRAADQGQFNNGQHNNQRYESPRYEAPANRPAPKPERDSPKSSGGSGGSASNGSGNQYSSGGGHSQPRSESRQNSGGSQNSGSSSHNSGQASGSSGHSGNSGSSTQSQPSKKN